MFSRADCSGVLIKSVSCGSVKAPVESESTAPTGQCCPSGGGEDCGTAAGGRGCCSSAK